MDLIVAGGVESMTRAPFVMPKAGAAWSRMTPPSAGVSSIHRCRRATAPNLAREHAISRAEQDSFALRSQERAAATQASGRLAGGVLPVTVPLGRGRAAEVVQDEHPRATTLADLAGLRPITGPDGPVTEGNASGVNDGTAALIVASAAAIRGHGLTPGARLQCESARQGGWNGDRSGKRQGVDEPVR